MTSRYTCICECAQLPNVIYTRAAQIIFQFNLTRGETLEMGNIRAALPWRWVLSVRAYRLAVYQAGSVCTASD